MKMNTSFIKAGLLLTVLLLTSGCALMKAGSALNEKNYPEAIRLYEEYLAENPEQWPARDRLAYAQLQSGQVDAAIENFSKVLTLKRDDPFALVYLGMAYMQKGNFEMGAELWRSYTNPDKPWVEAAVRREMTMVKMLASRQIAKTVLAQEDKQAPKTEPDSVAVLYYADLSKNQALAPIRKGLASMIIADLAQIKSITLVERVRVQELLEEMKLGQTGIVDAATAPRVGRLLGAETLFAGNMDTTDPGLLVNTSLASAPKKGVTASFSQKGGLNEFWALEKDLVKTAVERLGVKLTPAEQEALKRIHTKSFQALSLYSQALDARDDGRWQEAIGLFEQALKADPEFFLARNALDNTPTAVAPPKGAIMHMTLAEMGGRLDKAVNTMPDPGSLAQSLRGGATGGGGGGGG